MKPVRSYLLAFLVLLVLQSTQSGIWQAQYISYTEMNRRWALVTEDVKEVRKDQWWRRWPRRAWGVLTIERNSPGMLELGTYAYYVAIGWAFLTSLSIYLNNYS